MKLQTTVRINGEVYALFDTMRDAFRFVRVYLMNPDHQNDLVTIK